MKYQLFYKIILNLGLFLSVSGMAQNTKRVIPDMPKPTTFHVMTYGTQPIIYTPPTGMAHSTINRPNTNQQLSQYEKDRQEVLMREQALKDASNDFKRLAIRYSLPSFQDDVRTQFYREAFDKLAEMDPDDFSVKKATFIIENAFFENQRDYVEFENTIETIGKFIKLAMKEQGLSQNNNLHKNLSIYQYIADTLTANDQSHKPYKYDFNDYMGRKNWDNMFVSKLLATGKGQCNSMPRLYLILAEELEAESYLALAPNHSFIRFKGENQEWHNAELTSGAFMSDIFMLDSGFIKSEAIVSGNYMSQLTNRQLMAELLNDLAAGYISKFGRDEFVEQVINKSLDLNPNGINANLHQFNFGMQRLAYIAMQIGAKTPSDLQLFPKAVDLYNDLIQQQKFLKELGFEEMPKERYDAWLQSLEKEKAKHSNNDLLSGIKQNPRIRN